MTPAFYQPIASRLFPLRWVFAGIAAACFSIVGLLVGKLQRCDVSCSGLKILLLFFLLAAMLCWWAFMVVRVFGVEQKDEAKNLWASAIMLTLLGVGFLVGAVIKLQSILSTGF